MKSFVTLMFILCYFGSKKTVHCHGIKQPNVGIVGGHGISIDQVPYMVSVRIYNGTYHFCGGSILNELFVLTAAHCIKPIHNYSVMVGTDQLEHGGTLYNVSEIISHENFNPKSFANDICILKLDKPLVFGRKVNKIVLPDKKLNVRTGTILDASGWGSTRPNGDVSNKLQQVSVPKISIKKCRRVYARYLRYINTTMICAGGNGHDSCQGDSGGPLTMNGVQVGVTSAGGICGAEPGIYTKVTSYLAWIKEKMSLIK